MILHGKSPKYIEQHDTLFIKFKTSKLEVLFRNPHRCYKSIKQKKQVNDKLRAEDIDYHG